MEKKENNILGNDRRYRKFTEKFNKFCDDKLSGKFEEKMRGEGKGVNSVEVNNNSELRTPNSLLLGYHSGVASP